MNIQSAPPCVHEPYPELIARLWAAGTNSADVAQILKIEEAEVERIRLGSAGRHASFELAIFRERQPGG